MCEHMGLSMQALHRQCTLLWGLPRHGGAPNMVSSWARALRTTSDRRIAPATCAASPAMKPTMQCRPSASGKVAGYVVTQNSGMKQSAVHAKQTCSLDVLTHRYQCTSTPLSLLASNTRADQQHAQIFMPTTLPRFAIHAQKADAAEETTMCTGPSI